VNASGCCEHDDARMPTLPNILLFTLFTFVSACCVVDLRTRRIPNALSGTALLVGGALNALFFGWSGLLWSLCGMLMIVAILLAPFALGGLGGGDVKMMAVVGAFLGPRLAVLGLMAGHGVRRRRDAGSSRSRRAGSPRSSRL